MSDENPLDDLSEQLEEAESIEDAPDEGADGAPDGEKGDDGPVPTARGGDPDEPAFPFSESKQGPIYPREATWEAYDDAIYEIEGVLREYGVRDPAGREFDDAVLRFAARNPEGVARILLEARGIELD